VPFQSTAKLVVLSIAVADGGGSAFAATAGNDYPTEVVADYVYGCLKANGETREALAACSCSVDVVASILPYTRYEEASTFRFPASKTSVLGHGCCRRPIAATASLRS
jgi:hypothetical protein